MVVEIDGAEGEGGGQMLRTALTLSIITQKPFRMFNIRANRPNPGLSAQHLTALLAAARISEAKIEGAYLRSKEIFFSPKKIISGNFSFKIETAGSTTLLLQTLYLPLAFAGGGRLTLEGGTHTKWSPPFDFLKYVFCKLLKRMDCNMELNLRRAGYYPKGSGMLSISISACRSLKSLILGERGRLRRLLVSVTLSRLPEHIAEREIKRLSERLSFAGELEVRLNRPDSLSAGNSVLLVCEFSKTVAGFAAVGERGRRAEEVADEVAYSAMSFLNSSGAVDVHSTDQLMLPAALADGETVIRTEKLTNHIKTNAKTLSLFLKRNIELTEDKQSALIRIT